MFQRFLFVIATLMAGLCGVSATVVKGVVTDTDGKPLIQATVRLLRADSTFITGTTTDLGGAFSIDNPRGRNIIVQASYIGYIPQAVSVRIAKDTKAVTVDTLRLRPSSIMLKEATVTGLATPIKVMEDTIEYNAESFTTPPNAMVGELLKRLPGVEVDSDGKITAQGQTVKKILIDGEEFFSDDPAVASKNIPVAMVKKAQVVNRKSDLARMTGVDDGEDETVINLTVKPEMKNGWFGQAEGGYGTDNRYKGSFVINRYLNKNTFTLLGNANNVNSAGFTDGNGARFQRFGGTSGINTTQSLGFNFNVGRTTWRFGGNVLYSHNDRLNESETHRQNLLRDGDTFDDSERKSNDRGHNVRGDFRFKWDPDSFNTFEFRPNFSLNYNDSHSSSIGRNYDADGRISDSRNISQSNGRSLELGGRLIYNHKFRSKPGRSFSISGEYRLSNVHETSHIWSRNAFWLRDSIYEDYQEIANHTWSNSVNSRLSWTEPLGDSKKGNYLEIAYQMDYRWNNADKTVHHDPFSEKPINADRLPWLDADWRLWEMADRLSGLATLAYDPVNSNSFRNNYFNQSARIGYKKVSKDYNLNAGISFNPQMSRSLNITNPDKTIPTRWVMNYAPFVRFRYKFDRQTSLNAFYNGRSSQPSLTQLQPVEDSSDPMNIIQGNPNLNPSFAHNMNLRFQTFNADKQQSVMAMLRASFTQNAIATNVRTNRTTGGRYTTYENVNGNWNLGFFTMYSRPLGSSKTWTFNNNLNADYRQTVGFISGEKNHAANTSVRESFGIAFRPDGLELELRPNYALQVNTNSIQSANQSTVHTYGGTFNGTWYAPLGLVLATDLTYSATAGYAQGYDRNEWMWNASLSYMFLKGKNATISVKAYDILAQRQSISRSETAQAITDTRQNVLGRYIMATFTYKFNSFGGGKTPTADTDDFMRPGPGGGGRPPMGPPPGGR